MHLAKVADGAPVLSTTVGAGCSRNSSKISGLSGKNTANTAAKMDGPTEPEAAKKLQKEQQAAREQKKPGAPRDEAARLSREKRKSPTVGITIFTKPSACLHPRPPKPPSPSGPPFSPPIEQLARQIKMLSQLSRASVSFCPRLLFLRRRWEEEKKNPLLLHLRPSP